MIIATVEPWVEAPLRRFVEDARARLALLLHPSGQVVAQAGFTRAVDVMTACALAAAVFATAGELGRQVDGQPFRGLHHAGEGKQLFLASAGTARGAYICLTVFDQESSLGLVRMFFADLCRELATASPPVPASAPALAANFEVELNENLAALFARGGKREEGSGERSDRLASRFIN
jgi:predicted regulator of Ras-like GTPase activity (Roadblock/LC7/MglB family)